MENFITSYLVKIGFEPDSSSYRKFSGALIQAERSVVAHTGGMARKVIEVQGAITGAFLGISAAILGVVDKTAMADQGYRLMGLRMMMTTESARKLDIITKTLGASLEEVIWDPELHQRANVLSADMDRMTKQLGPGFEGSMRSIRDFRAEFGRLEVGLQFLGMRFTEDLWAKLMPGEAGKSFHDWITWAEDHIEEWSGKLVGYAEPALRGTWEIAKATAGAVEQGTIAFTNMIGALSGDTSIESTALSFDNLAKAIGHVGDFMTATVTKITAGEKIMGDWASGIALFKSGDYAKSAAEFTKAYGVMTGEDTSAIHGPKTPEDLSLETKAGKFGVAPGAIAYSGPVTPVGQVNTRESQTDLDERAQWQDGFVKGLLKPLGNFVEGIAKQAKGPDVIIRGALDTVEAFLLQFGAAQTAKLAAGITGLIPLEEHRPRAGALAQSPQVAPAGSLVQPAPQPVANSIVDQLAAAIAKVEEGSKKDSIAIRNNNPGNLRTWAGYPTEGGYAKFPDMETGMAALRKQIELNIGRGLTLEEFFAGKKDVYDGFANEKNYNDPDAYSAWVAKKLGGVDVNTPLNQIVLPEPTPPMPLAQPSGAQTTVPIAKPIAYRVQPSIDRGSLMRDLPSADDNAPRIRFAGLSLPPASPTIWPSVGTELAAALASMQRPILPQPISSNIQHTNSIGDINIYITEPGANVDDIHRVVSRAVEQKLAAQTQFDLPQLRAAY